MDTIGIIVEYNPFHNGHLYMLNKVKEQYPNSKIVIILNGYFLERGLISLETKKEKTELALKYGADLVIELPFVFGSNSADTFASASLYILNKLKVKKLIFGSESNDINILKSVASKQLEPGFDSKLKSYLNEGLNYPTALNKAIGIELTSPNDLLGVSYIKAILKNNYDIEPITLKRTNDYHDNKLNDSIVSASNIRERLNNNEDITKYIPEGKIVNINYDLLFQLLKYKILSDDNLDNYLTVDEGIDNKLKKVINEVSSINELIEKIKTKRYTYNRLMRMFIHILIGYTKEDRLKITNPEYIRLLGFSEDGSIYLNSIKKELDIPLVTKYTHLDSIIKDYELKAASIYEQLTNENVMDFELNNKPIKKEII